jgi:N-acetylglucosamine kinase-like BadF-type ATPase
MSFRIGVDGGGTKTECILLDEQGTIAARQTAPGCNPSLVGPERARAVLLDALQAMLKGAGVGNPPTEITATLLCMAGSASFWRETAAAMTGYGIVTTASDSLPVLELATGGAPGLVLHAGTGSFVTARAPDGSIHYASGLGWRFGDAGSGYDLGRRGIARALLELQGWAERTALGEALCQHTGAADYAANSRILYSSADSGPKITAFASRVVDLAGEGCRPAQQVIAQSLSELAALVNAMLPRLFPLATADAPVPCGVSGLILNRPACLYTLHALATTHAWPVRLQAVTEPPIEGVRRLLQKKS